MKRPWLLFIGILLLAGLAGMAVWPRDIWFMKDVDIHLGLDLQGGTQLVYSLDLTNIPDAERGDSIEGVRTVIEHRINALGVSEPVIQSSRVGESDAVIVELPGIKDVNEAKSLIGETAQLEFWKPAPAGEPGPNPLMPGFIPSDLTGADLKKASVGFQNAGTQQAALTNTPQVELQFNDSGRDKFKALTEQYLGQQIAIVLDDQPISAPTVQSVITDGSAIISGQFALEEAKRLSIALNAGALPVPINLIEERTIGATLGAISIQESLFAGAVGLLLIAIFMIAYYRLPGLLATLALVLYTLFSVAVFELIPVTLTLAGLAGFILSVGMAVDANILIFERMREEQKAGKPLNLAIDLGFKRAWSSIFDSNMSSLITAAILYYTATGLVRGFALTLAIGILISMFTAIVVTRTFLRLVLRPTKEHA